MKKLLLILLLGSSVIITGASCNKFLDANPNSSVAVPTSLNDLQALLDHSNRMNLARTPSFSEVSCDDYFLLDETYNSFMKEIQTSYTWNRLPYNMINDWSIAYHPVHTSNYCLDQLQKIPITASTTKEWNNVKGSALFFRSYFFLALSWSHAKAYLGDSADINLGIVLRLNSDFNVPSVRATVRETYNRIIMDTKEAVTYLPELSTHVMRPSKAAAYGLLARAYLSMRQYDSAYRYSDLSLQLKNSLIDYNADNDLNGSVNATVPFKRFNKETVFYTEMNGNGVLNSFTRARVDTNLYNSYHNDDLRKKAFFRPSSPYYLFKGSYTANTINYFTGITTAEMYLTRAECNARMGNISNAMNDLNSLLLKRWDNTVPYLPITANDESDAINKVLAERRKELYMRGLRWMDIKRLNRENRNIILTRKIGSEIFTLLPNAGYYALPLPADIILLSGIEQN